MKRKSKKKKASKATKIESFFPSKLFPSLPLPSFQESYERYLLSKKNPVSKKKGNLK